MKELLFGWLTKPRYSLTFLEELAGALEIMLIACVILFIIACIKALVDIIKNSKE